MILIKHTRICHLEILLLCLPIQQLCTFSSTTKRVEDWKGRMRLLKSKVELGSSLFAYILHAFVVGAFCFCSYEG